MILTTVKYACKLLIVCWVLVDWMLTTGGIFHQHFMSIFWANIFTLILLAYSTGWEFTKVLKENYQYFCNFEMLLRGSYS